MIKRKRKINKKELINVRLYTVTGNDGTHHFIKGEVVRKVNEPPITNWLRYYVSTSTGLRQCLKQSDII